MTTATPTAARPVGQLLTSGQMRARLEVAVTCARWDLADLVVDLQPAEALRLQRVIDRVKYTQARLESCTEDGLPPYCDPPEGWADPLRPAACALCHLPLAPVDADRTGLAHAGCAVVELANLEAADRARWAGENRELDLFESARAKVEAHADADGRRDSVTPLPLPSDDADESVLRDFLAAERARRAAPPEPGECWLCRTAIGPGAETADGGRVHAGCYADHRRDQWNEDRAPEALPADQCGTTLEF